LFKEKNVFFHPTISHPKRFIHQFFSLFLKKWKKRKLIQEDARPFQIKEKIIEQKHPIKKASMQQKIFLKKI